VGATGYCNRRALGAGRAGESRSAEEVVVASAGVCGDHELAACEHESAGGIVGIVEDCSSFADATTVSAGVVGEDTVCESSVPVNEYSPAQ
jgi:hypothetical protein